MFETGEPRTAPEIHAALLAQRAEAEPFLAAIPTPELFAAQGAHWSPAEHARHLTKSIRPVSQALLMPKLALRLTFGKPSAPSRSFAGVREHYCNVLAGGADAGRFTPRAEPPPAEPEKRRAEIAAALFEQIETLAARLEGWDEEGLDLHQLPHPLLGDLTLREMLFFTLYHDAHHLRRVAERREPIG
jgi:hypothetical protein